MTDDDIIGQVTDDHIRFVMMKLEKLATTDRGMADRAIIMSRRVAPGFMHMAADFKAATAPIVPFPAFSDIVAAQCSIFDNWTATGGRKPSRKRGERGARMDRFKVTVEVWTQAGKIELGKSRPTFRGTAPLLTGPELSAKVAELRKPSKIGRPFKTLDSHDTVGMEFGRYGDDLNACAANMDGIRMGPMFTVTSGTHFHLDTFAVVNEQDLLDHSADLKVMVHTADGAFEFNTFADSTSNGNPLAKNTILQSRMSRFDGKWTTGILPDQSASTSGIEQGEGANPT